MKNWESYLKVHENRKPREQSIRAASYCKEKEVALDLGAGALAEAKYFLEHGFHNVVAVDSSPGSGEFAKSINSEHFSFANVTFQDFNFEEAKYDLINAQYSLPFNGAENFSELIQKITWSLKKEGIFSGQFFGKNDEWNTSKNGVAFQTKEEVLELLVPFEIIEFVEEENDSDTAAGNEKHWHVFHFIARKK